MSDRRFVQPQFASAGQPWLRQGTPPWHLWGNLQPITVNAGGFAAPTFNQETQLAKVAYKRPETFHWLFVARLISINPVPAGIQEAGVQVDFDLTVGLGRSTTKLTSFEQFRWLWNDTFAGGNIPRTRFALMYSTQVQAPLREYNLVAPPASQQPNVIDQLVAENIQLQVRVADIGNYVYTLEMEVSAYFAPKTHVRPEWYCDAPPEVTFPGDEIGGR